MSEERLEERWMDGVVPSGCSLVDWERVWSGPLGPYCRRMEETPQNPLWHGEGSVWQHTKLVCECLVKQPAWVLLDRRRQQAVWLAALLHDVGKTVCTRWEGGAPVSPFHAPLGDRMAREILWRECGMGGPGSATKEGYESQGFRELVCALIRSHSAPFHFLDATDPEHVVIRIAAHGDLAPGFSLELLCMLVEADMRGRVAPDAAGRLEHLEFFRGIAGEAECLNRPLAFPSAFSRYAYLNRRGVFPGQELYDDTWGKVVVLAGLPGTGKDTYAREVYEGWSVVSLDALRREMKISPEEGQGRVVSAAYEQAKGLLRRKQPFVWNATNVTPMLRRGIVGVVTGYGAAVKLIYLETDWETVLERNRRRERMVPEGVIAGLMRKLVPPAVHEAHEVEWVVL